MKLKKLAPIALALTVATSTAAGAANVQTIVKYYASCSIPSQAQQQIIQKLCEKFDFSFCGQQNNCPSVKPDETPDTTPDETPDTAPDETPDTTPDEIPDTAPDETPDIPPVTDSEQTPDSKPEQTPDNDTTQGNFAAQVAVLVNQERAKAGLSPLKVDAKVQQAAQVRAKETVQSFSHTRPNGTSCFTALTEAGVQYRGAGENIAYGQTSPEAVMRAWMNSEGHRKNILNSSFTTIGVGYTVVGGTPYWTQLFTY